MKYLSFLASSPAKDPSILLQHNEWHNGAAPIFWFSSFLCTIVGSIACKSFQRRSIRRSLMRRTDQFYESDNCPLTVIGYLLRLMRWGCAISPFTSLLLSIIAYDEVRWQSHTYMTRNFWCRHLLHVQFLQASPPNEASVQLRWIKNEASCAHTTLRMLKSCDITTNTVNCEAKKISVHWNCSWTEKEISLGWSKGFLYLRVMQHVE
jgi:hypothetical protein